MHQAHSRLHTLLMSIGKPAPLGFRSLSADAAMTEVMSCRSTVLSASSCVLVLTPISDTVGVDSMWGGGCTWTVSCLSAGSAKDHHQVDTGDKQGLPTCLCTQSSLQSRMCILQSSSQ